MAVSSSSKQVLITALTNKGASDVITDAIDANTLRVAASVTTTTSSATTTRLHTMFKALVASNKAAGLMS